MHHLVADPEIAAAAERNRRELMRRISSPSRIGVATGHPIAMHTPHSMTLARLESLLVEWHHARYGPRVPSPAAPHGVLLIPTAEKLVEEARELREAFERQDYDAMAVEAADIIFVLFHLIRGVGRSLPDAVIAKLFVIDRRLADPDFGRAKPAVASQSNLPGEHV